MKTLQTYDNETQIDLKYSVEDCKVRCLIIFSEVLEHDKEMFDDPENWQSKQLTDSPLIIDFMTIWQQLKETYKTELSALAFSERLSEEKVSASFKELLDLIK
jgi:hypothetical protein